MPGTDFVASCIEGQEISRRTNQRTFPLRLILLQVVEIGKSFYQPMNQIVAALIRKPASHRTEVIDPVLLDVSRRPNHRFHQLCRLAVTKLSLIP